MDIVAFYKICHAHLVVSADISLAIGYVGTQAPRYQMVSLYIVSYYAAMSMSVSISGQLLSLLQWCVVVLLTCIYEKNNSDDGIFFLMKTKRYTALCFLNNKSMVAVFFTFLLLFLLYYR